MIRQLTRRIGRFGFIASVGYFAYFTFYIVLMDRSVPTISIGETGEMRMFDSSFRWAGLQRSTGSLSFYAPSATFLNYVFYPADIAYHYQKSALNWLHLKKEYD